MSDVVSYQKFIVYCSFSCYTTGVDHIIRNTLALRKDFNNVDSI